MKTVTGFLSKYPIKISSTWASRNPHMIGMNDANHYKVKLRYEGRQFTLYYSKGRALQGEPTAKEVVETLAMDFACIKYGLDEFRDATGYERDDARRIFHVIETQAQKMYNLVGHEAFQEFKNIEEV